MADDHNEFSISAEEYRAIMAERVAGEICPAKTRDDLSIEDFFREMAEIIGYNLDEDANDDDDSEQGNNP